MADSPQDRYSSTFADMVFGGRGNPYPPGDRSHDLWELNARNAVQEIDMAKAAFLNRLPAEGAPTHEWLCWTLDLVTHVFNIYARRFLLCSVTNSESAIAYREILGDLREHYFALTLQKRSSFIPEGLLRRELRIRLQQRESHYRAEALRQVSELQAIEAAKISDNGKPGKPSETAKSITGSNIDRLRKECGWSLNDLADKTGLEVKLVRGHVRQGKGFHPKTLRTYAQAFSRELRRPVSVAELEDARPT